MYKTLEKSENATLTKLIIFSQNKNNSNFSNFNSII